MILAQDNILHILSYLPAKDKYRLNHEYYNKYHNVVFTTTYKTNLIRFVEDTIKRDNAFVLLRIIADIPHTFRKRIPAAADLNNGKKTISMLKFCKITAYTAESTKSVGALVSSTKTIKVK